MKFTSLIGRVERVEGVVAQDSVDCVGSRIRRSASVRRRAICGRICPETHVALPSKDDHRHLARPKRRVRSCAMMSRKVDLLAGPPKYRA